MNYYSATFWFPEEMGEVIVSLSLSARRGGTYSTSAPVPTGGWQTVFFDLSESGLSGAGRTLKLSVSASESGDFSFLTDMAAHRHTPTPFSARGILQLTTRLPDAERTTAAV